MMAEEDRLHIEQAAKGCSSGLLKDWPELDRVLKGCDIGLWPDATWHTYQPICKLLIQLDDLQRENDELDKSFDLRWDADMRAIKMWHDAGNTPKAWPDHADLVVWLLDQLDAKKPNGPHDPYAEALE